MQKLCFSIEKRIDEPYAEIVDFTKFQNDCSVEKKKKTVTKSNISITHTKRHSLIH